MIDAQEVDVLEMDDIHHADAAGQKWAKEGLSLARKSFDILFDGAPVMMHAVDRDQRIVRVNNHWRERLGYTKAEVMGRKSTEFLEQDSRSWAVEDMLPRFWHAGSAANVGTRLVRKDGQVLDVLIDAEVCPVTACDFAGYAAIRDSHSLIQSRQASTTIRALRELTGVQRKLESALEVQESLTHASEVGLLGQGLGQLMEVVQDISISLRGVLRAQQDSICIKPRRATRDIRHECRRL